LKFVNVGDEQKFPKNSVCIILVDLVYLESAKIYTGSKIVRGFKRLRTTAVEERRLLRNRFAYRLVRIHSTCS